MHLHRQAAALGTAQWITIRRVCGVVVCTEPSQRTFQPGLIAEILERNLTQK